VGRAFSRVFLFVCLSVCLFVRALKGKRLELATPNLVHVYSIAVARHASTQRSKRQRSRSHYTKIFTVARLLVTIGAISHTCTTCGRCRRASACRYDCLCFPVVMRTFAWLKLLDCCVIYTAVCPPAARQRFLTELFDLLTQEMVASVNNGSFHRSLFAFIYLLSFISLHRCGLLLQMSHAARFVCLCVCILGTRMSCAKTAKPIEMPFKVLTQRTMY